MAREKFHSMVMSIVEALNHAGEVKDIVALYREDAMDIISMDDE